jgi:16S rRNA (guanine527-N7)-methyltransferase
MELIRKYFQGLDRLQSSQFEKLLEIIPPLNQKVNIISRKDMAHLEERHILHSLSIAKQFEFGRNISVIDAGTGGGFPGIPLAILFPEAHFMLVDSIGKKIRMVREICDALGLKNTRAVHSRVEELEMKADFVVSRAVTAFPRLVEWTDRLILTSGEGSGAGGWIALKGGDLLPELGRLSRRVELYPVSTWFQEPFFSTKTIVYLKK